MVNTSQRRPAYYNPEICACVFPGAAKNSSVEEESMQRDFFIHFMVSVEFSTSAQSPCVILIKYVLIVHSTRVSFLPFLIKYVLFVSG